MSRMNPKNAGLWIALAVVALVYSSQRVSSANHADDDGLQKMLQDRVELHRGLVKVFESIGNESSKEEVAEVKVRMHRAEFEAAESKEKRIEALTKIVDIRKAVLQWAGKIDAKVNLLQRQIDLADAEIALAREKLKS